VDNDEILGRFLIEIDDLPDGLPAEVHEGLRLDEQHAPAPDPPVADQGLEFFLLHGDAGVIGEGIEHEEAHVVACHAVWVARVSQAGDNFHHACRSRGMVEQWNNGIME